MLDCFVHFYQRIKLLHILLPRSWTPLQLNRCADRQACARPWLTNIPSLVPKGFWMNSNTQGHIFSAFEYSNGCSFWSWLWNSGCFFFFFLWKRNVNINLKWSLDRLIIWWSWDWSVAEGLILSINSQQEHQTGNKSVTFQNRKDSKQWPNWLPLCSPCHLIALWRTEKERRESQ